MSAHKCSCDKFERLEGASVNAYASAFLEDSEGGGPGGGGRLRCRSCGAVWEKRAPDARENRARPSLVKIRGR